MKKATIAAFLAMLCTPLYGQQANAPDLASQNAALEEKVRDLEDRLIALEGKVRTLQTAQAPPAQPAVEGQPAAASPTIAAAAPSSGQPAAEPQAPVVPTGTSPV